jgi:uncharacterized protein involved in exopolysaccharide biosynthesis
MQKGIREVLANEEISLTELFQLFYQRRKIIYISMVVILFLGIVKSCTSPDEYESIAIKLSEAEKNENGLGNLGSLAGFAGMNLSSMNGANTRATFSPEMYPKLLSSKHFLVGLINQEFYFSGLNQTMTLRDYYLQERPADILTKTFEFIRGIPYLIGALFEKPVSPTGIEAQNDDPIEDRYLYISPQDGYVINQIENKIKIEIEERLIKLSVRMPEPLIAAELNTIVFDKILEYVTSYKIEKQKVNLNFIGESTVEAEENFKKAQLNLANFRDSNQGIISQRARTKEEQLEAEFNLSFQLYSTLKQELENSKIELKRETPVFSSFQDAIVPNTTANTTLLKIILFSLVGGFFLGIFLIMIFLIRDFIKS